MTQRNYYLKTRYGITEVEYDTRLTAQHGACAICRRPPKTRRLHVDHDHKTGKVRGLLCWACNSGLQKFRDNPTFLEVAAAYLHNAS